VAVALLSVGASAWAGDILFIGQSGYTSADGTVIAHLENDLGHTVTFVNHTDAAGFAAAIDGVDLLIISSSVNSSSAVATVGGATACRDLNKPVMLWEDSDLDEFQMRAVSGGTPGVTQLDILLAGDPLVAGLSSPVTFYSQPKQMSHGSGAFGAGAHVVGQITGGGAQALFYYNPGDLLVDGTPAPAPRLAMCLWDDGFDFITADGLTIFDRAVAQVIPEPATMSLLGLGAVALLRRRR
jgi:hypothetical protein